MLYRSEELNLLYKDYLKNKKHNGKPYTQSWFSVLLLEANSLDEIYERERLPVNRKKKITISNKEFKTFKKMLKDGYRWYECENYSGISKYIYNRIENYGERWRIT